MLTETENSPNAARMVGRMLRFIGRSPPTGVDPGWFSRIVSKVQGAARMRSGRGPACGSKSRLDLLERPEDLSRCGCGNPELGGIVEERASEQVSLVATSLLLNIVVEGSLRFEGEFGTLLKGGFGNMLGQWHAESPRDGNGLIDDCHDGSPEGVVLQDLADCFAVGGGGETERTDEDEFFPEAGLNIDSPITEDVCLAQNLQQFRRRGGGIPGIRSEKDSARAALFCETTPWLSMWVPT